MGLEKRVVFVAELNDKFGCNELPVKSVDLLC